MDGLHPQVEFFWVFKVKREGIPGNSLMVAGACGYRRPHIPSRFYSEVSAKYFFTIEFRIEWFLFWIQVHFRTVRLFLEKQEMFLEKQKIWELRKHSRKFELFEKGMENVRKEFYGNEIVVGYWKETHAFHKNIVSSILTINERLRLCLH